MDSRPKHADLTDRKVTPVAGSHSEQATAHRHMTAGVECYSLTLLRLHGTRRRMVADWSLTIQDPCTAVVEIFRTVPCVQAS